jgi:Peroxiredoxin
MPTQALQTTVELDQARERYRSRVIPPERLKIMDDATGALVRSGLRSTAVKEGDRVADFTLTDAHGKPVQLQQLLETGPVVVTFYRGGWCPYCNIELRGLQRALPEIKELGASLIAISPQLPDNSLSTEEKNSLTFPVLSDVGNVIARRFGIAFRLPDDLLKTYQDFDHGLEKKNGREGALELPMPATYVLNNDGTVISSFVDEDYTKRLDPDAILTTLRKLRSVKVADV